MVDDQIRDNSKDASPSNHEARVDLSSLTKGPERELQPNEVAHLKDICASDATTKDLVSQCPHASQALDAEKSQEKKSAVDLSKPSDRKMTEEEAAHIKKISAAHETTKNMVGQCPYAKQALNNDKKEA
jgi:hypothetical protein